LAQAKLRQQQNETIDQVKKAYYSVLQMRNTLSSVEEALKSYHELDKTLLLLLYGVVMRYSDVARLRATDESVPGPLRYVQTVRYILC
jgi:outer membrane protein TolC